MTEIKFKMPKSIPAKTGIRPAVDSVVVGLHTFTKDATISPEATIEAVLKDAKGNLPAGAVLCIQVYDDKKRRIGTVGTVDVAALDGKKGGGAGKWPSTLHAAIVVKKGYVLKARVLSPVALSATKSTVSLKF